MGLFSFGKSDSKINWIQLIESSQLEDFQQKSHQTPVLLFKHSTRCSISRMAKSRLEGEWDFEEEQIIPVYLDLLAYRLISGEISEKFNVVHESPQVILLKNGDSVYTASHNGISADALKSLL